MKKILLIGISILFILSMVYAKPIEVSVSPEKGIVNTGSSVEFFVTVKNNQDVSDDVGVYVSGEIIGWARLSKTDLTMPPKSNERVILTIAPPAATPSGSYELTVTASSAISEDRWDSKSITLEIYQRTPGIRGFHDQVTPVPPIPPKGDRRGVPRFGLNLYYNPKLSTDRGYNLKDGDQCCVGDTLTLMSEGSGEFYGKGGPIDSPPVVFVDDLDATIEEIKGKKYKPKTYVISVGKWGAHAGRIPNVVDAAVICESPCKSRNFGNIKEISKERFQVLDGGMVESYTECSVRCIMYYASQKYCAQHGSFIAGVKDTRHYVCYDIDEGEYGFLDLNKTKTYIQDNVFINAVSSTRGPDINVRKYTYNTETTPVNILVEVENTGDMKAELKKVSLNIPNYKILYMPSELMPGETSEIIIEADVDNTLGLKATVKYRSDKLGCAKTKDFKESFAIGGCNNDIDCNDNNPCTKDTCTNAGSENSYCSNTAYCEGTDSNCGCTSCESCDVKDSYTDCEWSCLDSDTRLCSRSLNDYYCSGVSCDFTKVDASYTEDCKAGEICDNGICTTGCDMNDGTWDKIPALPGCGVKDTDNDGKYDTSCCDGRLGKIEIAK